jgi:hypothetical protein
MLPDLLFGTPVPQLRTTQLLAFCLGLPGLVLAAQRGAPAATREPARPAQPPQRPQTAPAAAAPPVRRA